MAGVLYHFSDDPAIAWFAPHVPATNPTHDAAVWAIDAEHAPLYWFPRDCPRVAVWPASPGQRDRFAAVFRTTAHRVHAVELAWLDRIRSATVYRYELPAGAFRPWPDAAGQFISDREIHHIAVEPLGDLLALHAAAGIELRFVPALWPLIDLVTGDEFEFSVVRKHNAAPREV